MDWASTDPHIQRYVQKTSTTGEETAPDVKEWRYWQSFCQRASSHSPHSKVVYIWKKSHYTSTFWQSCWMSFLRCKYMLTQKKFRSQLLFMFWKSLGKVSWEKKNCCSFGFCPSYLPPSPPNLVNLNDFFSDVEIQDLKVSLGLKILYILNIILYIYTT